MYINQGERVGIHKGGGGEVHEWGGTDNHNEGTYNIDRETDIYGRGRDRHC